MDLSGDIKMAFDYKRFFEDYGIQYWASGKNVPDGACNTQCCHCDDRSNHLAWNNTSTYCWRCGEHSLFSSIKELLGCDNKTVFSILKEKYNTLIDEEEEKIVYHNQTIEVPGSKLLPQHIKYLEGRRFDVQYLINKYDLRGTLATGDIYAYRVITPIYYNHRIVSYQGRDFTGKQNIRYATCKPENEIIHHKKILFNLDNSKQESVIVMEGVYDVFRFGDNSIATMGISYTKEQLALLAKRYRRVYTMFDPEVDAQNRAKILCSDLSMAGLETVNILLDEGDPAEQSEEVVREIKRDLGL